MAIGMIIYGVILATVMLLTFVYLFFLMFYKQRRKPKDCPILLNLFMKKYTKGHSIFLVNEKIEGNLRIGFKLIPRDIKNLDYYNIRKRRYIIPEEFEKPFIFWVLKDKVHNLPSSFKNIIFIEPFDISNIDKDIINTTIGRQLMRLVDNTNEELSLVKFKDKEIKTLTDLNLSNLVGELTPELWEKIITQHELSIETTSKEKEKKTTGFYPPSQRGY